MAAPFSFHCSICIEAFDTKEHPPVVLPCGHTFLCLPCSKRLKTCMECRTPLFVTRKVPQIPQQPSPQRNSIFGRSPQYSVPSSPLLSCQGTSKLPELEALPIPKNLVLLSLVENSRLVNTSRHDDDKEYDSGDDDFQVMREIARITSSCGTFVIKEKKGLVVHPKHPFASNFVSNYSEKENELACHAVKMRETEGVPQQTFVDERMLELNISRTNSDDLAVPMVSSPTPEGTKYRLCYGQTVQVVSIQGEVAKLARGLGFVQAKSDQLVKIGIAKDEACRLQAALESLAQHRQHLSQKLDSLQNVEARVKADLDCVLQTPYDNQFSMAPTFENDELNAKGKETTSANPRGPDNYAKLTQITPGNLDSIDGRIEISSSLEYSPSNTSTRQSYQLLPSFGDLGDLLMTSQRNENSNLFIPSLGCTMLSSFFDIESSDDDEVTSIASTRRQSSSTSLPWASSSSDRPINFRTGMSGHLALTSASSHVNRATQARGEIRMMGEHRGIGRTRLSPSSPPVDKYGPFFCRKDSEG